MIFEEGVKEQRHALLQGGRCEGNSMQDIHGLVPTSQLVGSGVSNSGSGLSLQYLIVCRPSLFSG